MPPALQNCCYPFTLLDFTLSEEYSPPGIVVASVKQTSKLPESGLCWEIHTHAYTHRKSSLYNPINEILSFFVLSEKNQRESKACTNSSHSAWRHGCPGEPLYSGS